MAAFLLNSWQDKHKNTAMSYDCILNFDLFNNNSSPLKSCQSNYYFLKKLVINFVLVRFKVMVIV